MPRIERLRCLLHDRGLGRATGNARHDRVDVGAGRGTALDGLEAVEEIAHAGADIRRVAAFGVDASFLKHAIDADPCPQVAGEGGIGRALGDGLLPSDEAFEVPIVERQAMAVEVEAGEGLRLVDRQPVKAFEQVAVSDEATPPLQRLEPVELVGRPPL